MLPVLSTRYEGILIAAGWEGRCSSRKHLVHVHYAAAFLANTMSLASTQAGIFNVFSGYRDLDNYCKVFIPTASACLTGTADILIHMMMGCYEK